VLGRKNKKKKKKEEEEEEEEKSEKKSCAQRVCTDSWLDGSIIVIILTRQCVANQQNVITQPRVYVGVGWDGENNQIVITVRWARLKIHRLFYDFVRCVRR
jgi:hypothetical protein